MVLPEAGYDGNGGSWFTNWVDQHAALGTANWETFEAQQVIGFIDANLRTKATRSARAVAGLQAPADGQKVSFDLETGRDGRESAVNVRFA